MNQPQAESMADRLAAIDGRYRRQMAANATHGLQLPARWGDIGLLLEEGQLLAAERDILRAETARLSASCAQLAVDNRRLRAELADDGGRIRRQKAEIDILRAEVQDLRADGAAESHPAILWVAPGPCSAQGGCDCSADGDEGGEAADLGAYVQTPSIKLLREAARAG